MVGESSKSIFAGGDERKKNILKKKDRAFHYLTIKVLKEQQQQKLAAIHYGAANTWFLFTPTILITLFSAVLSLLIGSTLVPSQTLQTVIVLTITVLQLVLSLFQSISKQLNLGGKAGFHQSAASSLKKIYEQALYSEKADEYLSLDMAMKTNSPLSAVEKSEAKSDTDEEKKKGDEENPQPTSRSSEDKNGGDDQEPEKPTNTVETLNQQYTQAVDQADSPIPIKISAAFDMLESRINTINKSLMRDNNSGSKISWEKVNPAVYHQLSETITHSRGWPLVIPSPKWSVEQALKDFKHSLRSGDNDNYLINEIVAQAATITKDHTAKAITEDNSGMATTEDQSKETDHLIPKTPEPYPDSAGAACTIV